MSYNSPELGLNEATSRIEPLRMKYSICVTHYNNRQTVETSLNHILGQVPHECELIVVDQMSDDGSREILERYDRAGLIRLYLQPVKNRGLGRQYAFERSSGEYIISSVDMDDEMKPLLRQAIGFYHKFFEGDFMLMTGFSIAPRKLIEEIGGWRDLQCHQDWDIWMRAAAIKKFVFVPFDIDQFRTSHSARGARFLLRHQYEKARDMFRLGRNPLKREGRRLPPYLLTVAVTPAAYVRSRFMQRFEPAIKGFETNDYAVEVDFEKFAASNAN